MNKVTSLTQFDLPEKNGADCTGVFQTALNGGFETILVPEREYLISDTLEISRNTSVIFDGAAKVAAMPGFHGPLFRNSGNGGISIRGGFFVADSDIFIFDGANGLETKDCFFTNTKGNFVTGNNISDFRFENLRFSRFSKGGNGSGICLSDGCRNGKIHGVKFITEETFDGNVISLTACGEKMHDIEIDDVSAIGCSCFVFADAKNAKVTGLSVYNVAGGAVYAAKLCGSFADVKLLNFEIFACGKNNKGLIYIDGKLDGFELESFSRPGLLDCDGGERSPTVCFLSDGNHEVKFISYDSRQTESAVKNSALSAAATHIHGGKPALDCLLKRGGSLCIESGGLRKLIINNNEELKNVEIR